MKIGILTFQRTTNFGSYLQAFALYKKIKDLGYDCEIIDYRCPAIEKREQLEKHMIDWSVKGIARAILLQPAVNRKARALSRFSENNIKVSREYIPDNINEAAEMYDKIIVGSDIVWGMDITDNDWNYFLDFVKDNNKKFAFSSSFGSYHHSENDIRMGELLRTFMQIAVRENDAVDWVSEIAERRSVWVCDPTMLLTKEEWISAIVPVKPKYRKYVLVYFESGGKCVSDAKKWQS